MQEVGHKLLQIKAESCLQIWISWASNKQCRSFISSCNNHAGHKCLLKYNGSWISGEVVIGGESPRKNEITIIKDSHNIVEWKWKLMIRNWLDENFTSWRLKESVNVFPLKFKRLLHNKVYVLVWISHSFFMSISDSSIDIETRFTILFSLVILFEVVLYRNIRYQTIFLTRNPMRK